MESGDPRHEAGDPKPTSSLYELGSLIQQKHPKKRRPFIDFGLVTGVMGALIVFFGMALLLPALIAAIYGESSLSAFLLTGIPAIIFGGLMYIFFRPGTTDTVDGEPNPGGAGGLRGSGGSGGFGSSSGFGSSGGSGGFGSSSGSGRADSAARSGGSGSAGSQSYFVASNSSSGNRDIRAREAFLIVALTWFVGSLIGAVPFIASGTLTSYTDAVFETMSGLTTTGATIFQVSPDTLQTSTQTLSQAATNPVTSGTITPSITTPETITPETTITPSITTTGTITPSLTTPSLTTTGLTTTGTITPLIEDLDRSLLFWRSLTHWIGGMGIIILSLALLPFLGVGGMQLYQAEYSGSKRDKLKPRVQKTAMLLWTVYAGLTAAQFLMLWVHPSMDWLDALNHAFSTLATGGFSTKNGSLADFSSAYIDAVTTLFMFLAGINFALHFRLFTGKFHELTSHRELRFYLLMTLISIAVVVLALWTASGYTFADALRYGTFQVVSILTTTGFGTDDYTLWASFASFFLFVLFFTGGMAGSTSGGVKTIRILLVLKNAGREFKQLMHPKAVFPVRLGDKAIDPSILKSILSFAVVYVTIFFIGAIGMSLMGYDLMSSMGASIASLGNIGPGWGDFGPSETYAHVPAAGKWLLLILMLIGRLELFTILILFTPVFWRR